MSDFRKSCQGIPLFPINKTLSWRTFFSKAIIPFALSVLPLFTSNPITLFDFFKTKSTSSLPSLQ